MKVVVDMINGMTMGLVKMGFRREKRSLVFIAFCFGQSRIGILERPKAKLKIQIAW